MAKQGTRGQNIVAARWALGRRKQSRFHNPLSTSQPLPHPHKNAWFDTALWTDRHMDGQSPMELHGHNWKLLGTNLEVLLNIFYIEKKKNFLDASLHLYKRVCPLVCLSVRPSVGPSVRRSVHPLVRPSIHHTLLFCFFAVFGLTAPAQMIKWPQKWPLPTRTRLG